MKCETESWHPGEIEAGMRPRKKAECLLQRSKRQGHLGQFGQGMIARPVGRVQEFMQGVVPSAPGDAGVVTGPFEILGSAAKLSTGIWAAVRQKRQEARQAGHRAKNPKKRQGSSPQEKGQQTRKPCEPRPATKHSLLLCSRRRLLGCPLSSPQLLLAEGLFGLLVLVGGGVGWSFGGGRGPSARADGLQLKPMYGQGELQILRSS